MKNRLPDHAMGLRPHVRVIVPLLCLLITTFVPAYATEVKEVTSRGGFKAWLVEEHALPIIAVKIAFTNAGYAYDPRGKEGRAHLGAELLLEGAGDMDSVAFHEALEENAISLNADPALDDFYVSMQTLTENRDKAFTLLGLALAQPEFDEEAVLRIKAENLTALLRLAQDPSYALHTSWQEAAYGNSPYGKPERGTRESVKTLSPDDFSSFQKRYLTCGNIVISVVGDITPEALSDLLDRSLNKLPPEYQPEAAMEEMRVRAHQPPVIIHKDIPQTLVSFGLPGIKRADPRWFDAYVMNYILGGATLTSRLGHSIREDKGLAYYVSSQLEPARYSAEWSGTFATRNEQVSESVAALKKTLEDFRAHGITEQELTDAKQYINGAFLLSLDSNADVAAFLLSMQLNGLGRDYLDKRNTLVNAVTKHGVERMANELIRPDDMLMVMVGKPEKMELKTDANAKAE